MVYKPLDVKTYISFLKKVGWNLRKGKIDYKLYDEHGKFICAIKISHGIRSRKSSRAVCTELSKNLKEGV